MERRKSPRIQEPFPIEISGIDAQGRKFCVSTVLDNLGAGGLYLRLSFSVQRTSKLHLVFRLSASADTPSPRVAATGFATRIEQLMDGTFGIAVAFRQHRFV